MKRFSVGQPDFVDNFIGIKRVMELTSLSKSAIYALISAQQFPKQVALSPRRVAWSLNEIEAFMAQKKSQRGLK